MSNIIFIENEVLKNVVINSDMEGRNEINTLHNLKYNRLVNNAAASYLLSKNTVFINEIKYSDSVIITDENGNNTRINMSEFSLETSSTSNENNIFLKTLQKTYNEKGSMLEKIDTYLTERRESVQSKLKTAYSYFNSKSYIKANELYGDVLLLINADNYPDEFMLKEYDMLAIKFAYALSKMAICKYEELKSAVDILTSINSKYGAKFPTLCYYLARLYYLLEDFDIAKEMLESGSETLKHFDSLIELNWPASKNKMITKNDKSLLEKNMNSLLKDCSALRIADAKCYFSLCKKKNMFFDSPCFKGYVSVKCSYNCKYTYHRSCWKMKLKCDGIKKPSAVLNKSCATESCEGIMSSINIYDENLHVNACITPLIKPKLTGTKVNNINEKETKKIESNPTNETSKALNCKVSKKSKPDSDKKHVDISDIKNKNAINKSKKDVQHIHKIADKLDSKHEANKPNKKEVISDLTNLKPDEKKKNQLNTNAEEYFPLDNSKNSISMDSKLSKLNSNAKEYVPSRIKNDTKIIHQEANLFEPNYFPEDVESFDTTISNIEPFISSNVIDEHNNTARLTADCSLFVNYSQEDAVSLNVDFVPDVSPDVSDFKNKNSQCSQTNLINVQSVSTQSVKNISEKFTQANNDAILSKEIVALKAQVKILQIQLFETEEAYNQMQYKIIRENIEKAAQENAAKKVMCDNTMQTDEEIVVEKECTSCSELQNTLLQKENDYSAAQFLIKDLENTNANMNFILDELKLYKENYSKSQTQLTQENDALKLKVQNLEHNMVLLKNCTMNISQNDNGYLRKILIDQIGFIRNAYLGYYTMYENKCKHVLWELDDVRSMFTTETVPTKAELEENYNLWRKAIDDSARHLHMTNNYFNHLYRNFANENPRTQLVLVPTPLPNFMSEPTNIMVRHFKSLLAVNKRLDQELKQQMALFYKMISTPYPGFYPNQIISGPGPNNIENPQVISSNTTASITEIPNNYYSETSSTEQLNNFIKLNKADLTDTFNSTLDTEKVLHKSLNTSLSDTNGVNQEFSNCQNINSSGSEYLNLNKNNVTFPKSLLGPLHNKPASSSQLEITEQNRNESNPTTSTGTIPKNKTAEVTRFETSDCTILEQNKSQVKSKPDVVGQESLINKIKQKLPLVSPELIVTAVQIMRDKHGSLTGMDGIAIFKEIKEILREISLKEKSLRKKMAKIQDQSLEMPWKKLDNKVHWSNDNPDKTCSICFEHMTQNPCVTLRCQHIFHTNCIKQWLQNDSICPICRSFTTLDEEFPPLK